MIQAVILAGGQGTRMRKKYPSVPKLLIPFFGKPFLNYLTKYLTKNGVNSIIICTGFLSEEIEKYIKRNKQGSKIKLSRENKPLGTGGALIPVRKMLKGDFFLIFGDVYSEVDLRKMFEFHKKKKALVTAAVHESLHPEDSNIVEYAKEGKIANILIKPHGMKGKNLYNLAALYILNERIFKYIPDKLNYDFEKDLLVKLVDENHLVYAYNTDELIMDIGTPERLAKFKLGKSLRE